MIVNEDDISKGPEVTLEKWKRRSTWIVSDQKQIEVYASMFDYESGEKPLIVLSAYEVIELLGRQFVVDHIRECDNSPWMTEWQDAKNQELLNILKR